ncbi:MAG: hypothetical protein IJ388_02900 [Oscillospiraceae bacterium]|nr:hypothetical protein [Oscillospiraceae bacterium]
MAVTFLTNEDESRILDLTAPSGYGWGETKAAAMPGGDANNALATGLYRATVNTANTPANCRLVFTQAANSGYIYQTAYCDGGVAWRTNDHNSWGEWEWISKKEKTYVRIATITVTPDTDGSLPQHVIFSADSNGNAFQLTDFVIRAHAGFVDGNKSTLSMDVNGGDSVISNGPVGSITADRRSFNIFFRQEEDGLKRVEYTSSGSANTAYNAQANNISRLIPPMSAIATLPITSIDLYTAAGDTKAWVEGSTFELWGVRA